jgi:hypothetical protein
VGKHDRQNRRSLAEWFRDWRRSPRPAASRTLYASNVLLLLIVAAGGVAAAHDLLAGDVGWPTLLEAVICLAAAAYLILWLRRPVRPYGTSP